MTSTSPTHHKPARWRAKAAVFTAAITAALGLATIPAFAASAAPATRYCPGRRFTSSNN
jgi:hypothetical protein